MGSPAEELKYPTLLDVQENAKKYEKSTAVERREMIGKEAEKLLEKVDKPFMEWFNEALLDPQRNFLISDAVAVFAAILIANEAVGWMGPDINENHRHFTYLLLDRIEQALGHMLIDGNLEEEVKPRTRELAG